jgi:hypothetical protein
MTNIVYYRIAYNGKAVNTQAANVTRKEEFPPRQCQQNLSRWLMRIMW